MKSISPFVVVANCKEEIQYYQSILGGEIKILREQDNKVLNSELHIGSFMISFADVEAAKPFVKGDYVKVIIKCENEEEFRKLYEALPIGGHIHTEMYEN